MNNANVKSSLSSKLEFHLEYCWLPVSGRHENFTGFNNDLQNLSQSVEQRSFHFTLATQPFCSLTRILKFETIHTFEFQRLDKEMNLKGKANHSYQRPWQIMQIGTLLSPRFLQDLDFVGERMCASLNQLLNQFYQFKVILFRPRRWIAVNSKKRKVAGSAFSLV